MAPLTGEERGDWTDLSLRLLYIACPACPVLNIDEPSIKPNCKIKLNYINMCFTRGTDWPLIKSNEYFHRLTICQQRNNACSPLCQSFRWYEMIRAAQCLVVTIIHLDSSGDSVSSVQVTHGARHTGAIFITTSTLLSPVEPPPPPPEYIAYHLNR